MIKFFYYKVNLIYKSRIRFIYIYILIFIFLRFITIYESSYYDQILICFAFNHSILYMTKACVLNLYNL